MAAVEKGRFPAEPAYVDGRLLAAFGVGCAYGALAVGDDERPYFDRAPVREGRGIGIDDAPGPVAVLRSEVLHYAVERDRAFHCIDISFWLLNTDRMLTHTGGGKAPRTLSKKMADALLHFMRTGDPNCKALPAWSRYTPERGELMILDTHCRRADDPDRSARAAFTD